MLHLYNYVRSRVVWIPNQQVEQNISALTSELFPIVPNRMFRCFGYMVFLLPSNLQHTSNILLCQCKMVRYQNVFVENIGSNNDLESIRKSIDDPDEIFNESNLSILSIDNTLESEYVITPSVGDTSTLQTIIPANEPFNSSCPICLEDFITHEEIVLLICHHGYHKDCLSKSLRRSASCPYCKSKSNIRTFRIGEEMPLLWRNLRGAASYGVNV